MTLSSEEVLALIPQQRPFRFIDRLIELSDTRAVGEYTFRADETFYPGHFPGDPVTPGVILIETMCQTGLVALGIYLLGLEVPKEEVAKTVTLFTDCQVEFERIVRPGDTVRVEAEKVFWRRRKLKSNVVLSLANGDSVAKGTVAGMGVGRG
ncbi:MAG: beta-hydroxyacyl-ACP dehydratase [Polyangiaceae bacterium]|nr:beta-hydroxyacyl-ACP dehydratase [Polyangiaceae bacterium]MCE7892870.1 beta-hydroxyacyl-ACP dehydratase [Sorangiineae bacterium PRO1]MCL4756119.1 beta-hydroxyacyl-ACP dehydratase [Myxococcales bacterium]